MSELCKKTKTMIFRFPHFGKEKLKSHVTASHLMSVWDNFGVTPEIPRYGAHVNFAVQDNSLEMTNNTKITHE